MPLTPDDIVNYPLKQSMRGYSVSQVDELLDQVADELERLHRELDDTRRRMERAEKRADSVSETETTLKRTLVTAERAAEQSLEEAEQEAADIVSHAEGEAERVRAAATRALRDEVTELGQVRDRLERRIQDLRHFEDDYRSRLLEVVGQHRRMLQEGESAEPDQYPDPAVDGDLDQWTEADWDEVWPSDVERLADSDVWQAFAESPEGEEIFAALEEAGTDSPLGGAEWTPPERTEPRERSDREDRVGERTPFEATSLSEESGDDDGNHLFDTGGHRPRRR